MPKGVTNTPHNDRRTVPWRVVKPPVAPAPPPQPATPVKPPEGSK